MDTEPWLQLVQQGGMAATLAAFLAGLVFSFNPVAMAAVPVALAYVTKAREARQAALYGAMFVVGMLVTHVMLGSLAGLGGSWVQGLLGRFWGLALGPILILLGLVWTGWVRLPLPAFALRARRPQGMWGAFALGVPFSIAICPVCTPALVVLLGVATTLGSAVTGAWLLDSEVTCPHCGHSRRETMPTDACLFFYECERCGSLLRAKPGDCCVFCSFGSAPCPPAQVQRACCT